MERGLSSFKGIIRLAHEPEKQVEFNLMDRLLSVGEIREQIKAHYLPNAKEVTLRFAGRVLKDNENLTDYNWHGLGGEVLHLT